MPITVSVTKDVTNLSVTDAVTQLNIVPQTTSIAVQNISITQSNNASVIGYTPSGHLEATTIQAALDEIAASPEFTTALKNKLNNLNESADQTTTAGVVGALTAGSNISITQDGTIAANVLGAISGGTGIDIDAGGVISVSDIAIATVQTAADETAHLGLTTQQGDVVIRTDVNKSYIHNGGTAGTMADFTELATNTNGVISINDATGAVTFGKSDLSDYSANEFIDWTTSQTDNIHADNYTNTTYSAGTGIQISESNEISATGGGGSGGTSFTTGGSLNLSDQSVLDVNDTITVNEVRLTDDDGVYRGLHLKAYQNVGAVSQFGDGLEVLVATADGSPKTIAALTENAFGIFPPIQSYQGFMMDAFNPLALHKSNIDVPIGEQNIPADSNELFWIGEAMNVITRSSGTANNTIASTEYVDNAITTFSTEIDIPIIPTTNASFTYVTKDNLGTYRATSLNLVMNFSQNGDDVRFPIFDVNSSSNLNIGNKIIAGTGVTLNVAPNDQDGSPELTISAQTDGLPDQSAPLNGYVLQTNGTTASWADISVASLPVQTDNSGKFLTTNGTNASWAAVDAFPNQFGQNGKALITNGTEVSWGEVDVLPEQSVSTYNKVLASSESGAVWATNSSVLPSQLSNSGKYLQTNGSIASWVDINTAGSTGQITFTASQISTSNGTNITSDRDIIVDGDIEADSFITTSGQGLLNSTTSLKIEADDGVYIDNRRIYGSKTTAIGIYSFNINVGISNPISVQKNGKDATIVTVTEGGKKYIKITVTGVNGYSLFPKAWAVQYGNANLPQVANVSVLKKNSTLAQTEIYLYLTGSDNTEDTFPSSTIYVHVYENANQSVN